MSNIKCLDPNIANPCAHKNEFIISTVDNKLLYAHNNEWREIETKDYTLKNIRIISPLKLLYVFSFKETKFTHTSTKSIIMNEKDNYNIDANCTNLLPFNISDNISYIMVQGDIKWKSVNSNKIDVNIRLTYKKDNNDEIIEKKSKLFPPSESNAEFTQLIASAYAGLYKNKSLSFIIECEDTVNADLLSGTISIFGS